MSDVTQTEKIRKVILLGIEAEKDNPNLKQEVPVDLTMPQLYWIADCLAKSVFREAKDA